MHVTLIFGSLPWAAIELTTPEAIVRPEADPCLHLRASPQSSAAVIDCFAPGTRVEVLEQAPYWRKVGAASREGWAAVQYLEDIAAGPPAGETEDRWLEVHPFDGGAWRWHLDTPVRRWRSEWSVRRKEDSHRRRSVIARYDGSLTTSFAKIKMAHESYAT